MAAAKKATDNGTMKFIVAILLLSAIGAGTGFAVGTLLPLEQSPDAASVPETAPVATPAEQAGNRPAGGKTTEAEGKDTAEAREAEPEEPQAVKPVKLPPILTTLEAPEGKWIRLEGSVLVLDDTEEPPELLAERSGEQIFTYLRSLRLEQLEGPSGVLGLRQDLNEMVQALSGGQVRGVLIHGLVVE